MGDDARSTSGRWSIAGPPRRAASLKGNRAPFDSLVVVQPQTRARALAVALLILCPAALPLALYGSVFLGVLATAVCVVLAAPFMGGKTRFLAVLAVSYLAFSAWILGSNGFLNYRISDYVAYRPAAAPPIRSVEIEVLVAANSSARRVLPGLVRSIAQGPYWFHVFLHDDGLRADRAKIDGAYVLGTATGERVALDLRQEVRWYLESRTFEDGWIPFQRASMGANARNGAFLRDRCGLRALYGTDLDHLGDRLILVMDVHLDKAGKLSTHHVEVPLHKEPGRTSGFSIHSP